MAIPVGSLEHDAPIPEGPYAGQTTLQLWHRVMCGDKDADPIYLLTILEQQRYGPGSASVHFRNNILNYMDADIKGLFMINDPDRYIKEREVAP